jgi:hypothetical protein
MGLIFYMGTTIMYLLAYTNTKAVALIKYSKSHKLLNPVSWIVFYDHSPINALYQKAKLQTNFMILLNFPCFEAGLNFA